MKNEQLVTFVLWYFFIFGGLVFSIHAIDQVKGSLQIKEFIGESKVVTIVDKKHSQVCVSNENREVKNFSVIGKIPPKDEKWKVKSVGASVCFEEKLESR